MAKIVVVALIVSAVLGAGLLGWIVVSQSGLYSLSKVAQKLTSGRLQVEGVNGPLSGPFRISRLIFENADKKITLEGIYVEWSLKQLHQRYIPIQKISVGYVEVYKKKDSDEPLKLPKTLVPPVAFDIKEASIGKLLLTDGSTKRVIQNIALNGSGGKQGYAFNLNNLQSEWGVLRGQTKLGAKNPFPIEGAFFLEQQKAITAYSVNTRLSGDLAVLSIDLDAKTKEGAATGTMALTLFDPAKIKDVQLQASDLNPQNFNAAYPMAKLQVNIQGNTQPGGKFSGKINITNDIPGPIDKKLIPLKAAFSNLQGTVESIQLRDIKLDLGRAGTISGEGQWQPARSELKLTADKLDLHQMQTVLISTKLGGSINLSAKGPAYSALIDLSQKGYRIYLDALYQKDKVEIRRAQLEARGGKLSASGMLGMRGNSQFTARGALHKFNPAAFGDFPVGKVNADFLVDGQIKPVWQTLVDITISDSVLHGYPLKGRGKFHADAKRIREADIVLNFAKNQFAAQGNFGVPGDRLAWQIDAQHLNQLGDPFAGSLKGSGTFSGSKADPSVTFKIDGSGLRLPGGQVISRLQGSGDLHNRGKQPSQAVIELKGYQAIKRRIDDAKIRLQGTLSQHTINLSARNPEIDTTASLTGGWIAERGWSGQINNFSNRGRLPFSLATKPTLQVGGGSFGLKNAKINLAQGSLVINELQKAGPRVSSSGRINNVPLAYLQTFTQRPTAYRTTLVLGGEWNVSADKVANGEITLRREQGDVVLLTLPGQSLGLNEAKLNVRIVQNKVQVETVINGSRFGKATLSANGSLMQRDEKWMVAEASPFSMRADAQMPSLAWLSVFGGPNLSAGGSLNLHVTGSGTPQNPILRGGLRGENLTVKLIDQGLNLKNGKLNADFQNNKLALNVLRFEGAEGTFNATGLGEFSGEPIIRVNFNAKQLAVIKRPDRTVVVSGNGNLDFRNKKLELQADLTTDRAIIELPKTKAPVLSEDIVIVGKEPPPKPKPLPFSLNGNIKFDLGERFYVKAKGADLRLNGGVHLRANGKGWPSATGTIRAAQGTYAAYGTRLEIVRGIINFHGPVNNPGLDILAVRRNLQVEAGVAIRGSAQSPVVRLVSTPDVPDSEKLSWMVLGHGLDTSNAQEFSVMSAAASSLLSAGKSVTLQAKIAQRLGLSEVGVSGTGGLETAVVTLGKQLSSRLYLTYEQGMGQATTLLKVKYLLTPRWSVQATTGADSALDLMYTLSFD